VKLHGDYLDTRILNTETELSTYSAAMNSLLDRIADEHGLISARAASWDAPSSRASFSASRGRLRHLREHGALWQHKLGDLDAERERDLVQRTPPLSAAIARQRCAFGQASDGGSEGMARPDPMINFAELDTQNSRWITAISSDLD